MLERLSDETLNNTDDEEIMQEAVDKYMKDLSQLMEGMLDLNRRNQLPDRERAIVMKLLLRLTLKEEVFDDQDRATAAEWLSTVEGE